MKQKYNISVKKLNEGFERLCGVTHKESDAVSMFEQLANEAGRHNLVEELMLPMEPEYAKLECLNSVGTSEETRCYCDVLQAKNASERYIELIEDRYEIDLSELSEEDVSELRTMQNRLEEKLVHDLKNAFYTEQEITMLIKRFVQN